jgi:hypothetical protein
MTVLRNTIGNIMSAINFLAQGTLTGINEITVTKINVNKTAMTQSTTHQEGRPTDTQDKSQTGSLTKARCLLATAVEDHTIPPIRNALSMGNPNQQ